MKGNRAGNFFKEYIVLSLPLLGANSNQPNLVAVSCLIMVKVALCDIF